MFKFRRAEDRGQGDFGWLKARYSFSFSEYHNEEFSRFRNLRVLNHDQISPGNGFDTHPHANMEILTYVIRGQLTHQDSVGNKGEVLPGEIQLMSAGSGIQHSEHNFGEETLELMQIWLLPNIKDTSPGYQQMRYRGLPNQLELIASPEKQKGVLHIKSDTTIYRLNLSRGQSLELENPGNDSVWIQSIRSCVDFGDKGTLMDADGLALENETAITLRANDASELLIFMMS